MLHIWGFNFKVKVSSASRTIKDKTSGYLPLPLLFYYELKQEELIVEVIHRAPQQLKKKPLP
jgi:hypothetical protein